MSSPWSPLRPRWTPKAMSFATRGLLVGGVAPKPWRLPGAESALRGASLRDVPALRRALERDFAAARPGRQNGFKIELARRTVVRALQLAGGVA